MTMVAGAGESSLPYSDDDERAVLSAVLIDATGVAADVAASILVVSDFFEGRHQRIFAAQLALREIAWAIDPHTVADELSRRGELASAGGKGYLGDLIDVVPTPANVEYHAQIVREKAILRGLIKAGEMTAQLAREGRLRAEEIAERLIAGVAGIPGTRRRPLVLLDDTAISHQPLPEMLVAKVLPAGVLAAMIGTPGVGKSFVSMELSCALPTRERFMGLEVCRRGPVVYVGAEGSAGFAQRINAWKHARGYENTTIGVHFVSEPVNLLVDAERERLLAAIRTLATPPVLIVFDTLARAMVGGDENSAKDMGLVVENADRIRRQTGATVLLVHHTKRDTDVERGSTSLRGAVDTLLLLKREDDRRTLRVDKQKDGPEIQPIPFELVPTLISCVVEVGNDVRIEEASLTGRLSEKYVACLKALSECALGGTASASTWMEVAGLHRATFYRYVDHLKREGYVSLTSSGASKRFALTDSGRAALSHSSQSGSPAVSVIDTAQSHASHTPLGVRRGETGATDAAEARPFELHLAPQQPNGRTPV